MNDDDTIMVGGPCEYHGSPLPGSTREPCVNCKREVWISPASMQVVRKTNAYIMCWPCARKTGQWEIEVHREQIREFLLHRQRN